MPYTPENNPYIPGDPYSYDLKWMVKDLKSTREYVDTRYNDIESQIEAIDIYPVIADTRRYIILGDSYATRTNSAGKTYMELVQESLGLSNVNFYHNELGGAAFAHVYDTHKFLTLLQNLSVTTPEGITDIIVVCGANDAAYPYNDTISAIADFVDYVKTAYINAKVYIFGCGLTLTSSGMGLDIICKEAFKNSAINGAYFIKGSDNILKNTDMLVSDDCHPSPAGVDAIANALLNAIETGSCDCDYLMSGFTPTIAIPSAPTTIFSNVSAPMYMRRKNDSVEITSVGGNNQMVRFTSNLTLNLAVGDEIDISLNKSLFHGEYIPAVGSKTLYGYIIDTIANKYYRASAVPDINSKTLKLQIFMKDAIPSSDGAYQMAFTISYKP